MNGFFLSSNNPEIHKLHRAIAKHLCVNAQITFLFKEVQYRVRNCTDAHLHGAAVFDVLGDPSANLAGDVINVTSVIFVQWVINFNDAVQLADVHKRIPKNSWHPWVDLGNYVLG